MPTDLPDIYNKLEIRQERLSLRVDCGVTKAMVGSGKRDNGGSMSIVRVTVTLLYSF